EARSATEPATAEQPVEPTPADSTTIPEAAVIEQTMIADTQAEEIPHSEPDQEAQKPPVQTEEQPGEPSVAAKQPRTRKMKQAADDGNAKKFSALDAAAKVLGETGHR